MKVWVTKDALTNGIREAEASDCGCGLILSDYRYFCPGEWYPPRSRRRPGSHHARSGGDQTPPADRAAGGDGVRGGDVSDIAWLRPTRVECAALLTEDGRVVSLPRPARHHDIIQHMSREGFEPLVIARCEQGFTTDTIRFVRRPRAMLIAVKGGQLKGETIHPTQLFSEDLW